MRPISQLAPSYSVAEGLVSFVKGVGERPFPRFLQKVHSRRGFECRCPGPG